MQPATDRSPAERDRAVDRVRRLTIGSTIAGYYQCGSGTHPGGCVMGAPGKLAAGQILKDRAKAGAISESKVAAAV